MIRAKPKLYVLFTNEPVDFLNNYLPSYSGTDLYYLYNAFMSLVKAHGLTDAEMDRFDQHTSMIRLSLGFLTEGIEFGDLADRNQQYLCRHFTLGQEL